MFRFLSSLPLVLLVALLLAFSSNRANAGEWEDFKATMQVGTPDVFTVVQPQVTVSVTPPTVTINSGAQSWAAPQLMLTSPTACSSSAAATTTVRTTTRVSVGTRGGIFPNRPRLFGHILGRRGGC